MAFCLHPISFGPDLYTGRSMMDSTCNYTLSIQLFKYGNKLKLYLGIYTVSHRSEYTLIFFF